jgi:hypothetical protein
MKNMTPEQLTQMRNQQGMGGGAAPAVTNDKFFVGDTVGAPWRAGGRGLWRSRPWHARARTTQNA